MKKKHIPNRLKTCRRLMGYSQEDIRRKLRLQSTSMISRWESGQKMPSGENLLKLSVLYKTLVNELYLGLTKEYHAEIYPAEQVFIRQRNRKARHRPERGP
jgi:transcriptional regulator with XRE-family HTH domain